jgi:FAD/FMN-containing dehydrogenase
MKPLCNIIFPLFELNPNKLYIDFGFWDFVKSDREPGHYNKKIENTVEKLKGKKSLYSESFYEQKDFWIFYNGNIYKKIKKKYDPNNVFLDLYEKCVNRK